MTTADCIRRVLKRKRWKQADLAREMEIPRSTVSGWVNGTHEPNLKSIRRIAEVCGVSDADLIGDDDRDAA